MKSRIAAALTLIALLAVPSRARAQEPACGDTSFASQLLSRWVAFFTDSAQARVRGPEIAQLSPNDVFRVVTDPRQCRRVIRAVRRYLLNPDERAKIMIFRFGPYYGVETFEKRPPGVQSTGGDALTIFRASNMRYVAVVIGI